ncbi:nucleotide sugar dehydrogenase [Pseudovirgaria hyperparasitica]|uniref:UDP-glucose 6-dehydrogenase n=1 Tax=Pseudovirgaria hyperparasitica TaxID=470096 RepID=A0A6A6WJA2_9PEZI|nr:nucleotide sugar dehydrogenase [Pseudovirgaria hyperparasitica]KAF2762295.1 nucleotide sugar dehydrogenase [Pseudovirgaria hyperparasitica]
MSAVSTPSEHSQNTSPFFSPILSRTSSVSSLSDGDGPSTTVTRNQDSLAAGQNEVNQVSKVCFVGAGYVGGPTAAVVALANPNIKVTVVDKDATRIRRWNSKHLPIHEPGLYDVVRVARDGTSSINTHGQNAIQGRAPNLFFSTDCDQSIAEADIVFLSVNTPTKMRGIGAGSATNTAIFESVMRSIARVAKPGSIIVEKSTVPCRTAEVLQEILSIYRPGVPFEILSNPEFLAEGTAISDLLHPSRVLIGSSTSSAGLAAAKRLASVYSWVPESAILHVHTWSSELAKLVANAMLAQRISSINSISAICEKTGANIKDISKAVGQDPRIGSKFLGSGLGFGGSCFKKDILSLSYLAESLDLPEVAAYWKSVVAMNEWQGNRFVHRVMHSLNGSLFGKRVTVFGYAFKKNTGDTRESLAIPVIQQLAAEGPTEISIYDPGCAPADIESEMRAYLPSCTAIRAYADPYEACEGTSAVLILTEWDQFRYPPLPEASLNVEAGSAKLQDALSRFAHIQSQLTPAKRWAAKQMPQAFAVEPECDAGCGECARGQQTGAAKHASTAQVQWEKIAPAMELPRWVFDARGVVETGPLEGLGFRVESVGCMGTRERRR